MLVHLSPSAARRHFRPGRAKAIVDPLSRQKRLLRAFGRKCSTPLIMAAKDIGRHSNAPPKPYAGRAASLVQSQLRQIQFSTKSFDLLERAMGIEPTTSSLGSWRSTAELRPRSGGILRECAVSAQGLAGIVRRRTGFRVETTTAARQVVARQGRNRCVPNILLRASNDCNAKHP